MTIESEIEQLRELLNESNTPEHTFFLEEVGRKFRRDIVLPGVPDNGDLIQSEDGAMYKVIRKEFTEKNFHSDDPIPTTLIVSCVKEAP